MKKIHPRPPEAWPESAKNLAQDFEGWLRQRIQTAHFYLLRLRLFWQEQHKQGLGFREFPETFLDTFLQPLSVRNREQHLSSLSAWLRYLHLRGELMVPLHQNLAWRKSRKSLRSRQPLNHHQVLLLMSLPDLDQPAGLRDRAYLEMAYATGMRNAELAELDLGDVDLSGGLVHIHRAKNCRERRVPLTGWAVHFLNRYLSDARPYLASPLSLNALWLDSRGKRLAAYRMGHLLRYEYFASRKLGVRVTMHHLRHTAATELLSSGADLRCVQELLGHVDLDSTETYTHVTPTGLRKVHQNCHPRNVEGFFPGGGGRS